MLLSERCSQAMLMYEGEMRKPFPSDKVKRKVIKDQRNPTSLRSESKAMSEERTLELERTGTKWWRSLFRRSICQ